MAAPATVSGQPTPKRHWTYVREGGDTGAISRKPGDLPFQENTSVGRGAPVSRTDRISGSHRDELPFSITAPMIFLKARKANTDLDITATSPCPDGKTQNGTADGVVVFVCRNCRSEDDPNADPRPGALLSSAAIAKAQDVGIEVRSVNCLANCKRGLSASIRSVDGWSYIFGGLAQDDAEDLLIGAQLLASAPDGLMPWRGRPDSLKRGVIARIPPFDYTEEKS